MNFFLLAFVGQIFGLYVMILLSEFLVETFRSYRSLKRLKKSTLRIRR